MRQICVLTITMKSVSGYGRARIRLEGGRYTGRRHGRPAGPTVYDRVVHGQSRPVTLHLPLEPKGTLLCARFVSSRGVAGGTAPIKAARTMDGTQGSDLRCSRQGISPVLLVWLVDLFTGG